MSKAGKAGAVAGEAALKAGPVIAEWDDRAVNRPGAEDEVLTIYLVDPHREYPLTANPAGPMTTAAKMTHERGSAEVRYIGDLDGFDAGEDDGEPDRAERMALIERVKPTLPEDDREWGSLVELKGTRRELHRVFERLLSDLCSPAWDTYGMGGDDNAYDYWPNSMRGHALRFAEIIDSWGPGPYGYESEAQRQLDRVYLAVRARYEREWKGEEEERLTAFDDFLVWELTEGEGR